MRRIILVASAVAAIFAFWAVAAYACIPSNPVVCAPPNNANYHASPQQQRATLPNNRGTQNAEQQSPAIQPFCGNIG